MFKTIEYNSSIVKMIDQTKLPEEEVYIDCKDYKEVSRAIQDMIIRGAPAIGVAAAMGVVLGVRDIRADCFESFYDQMEEICSYIASSRPTAVNLFWALNRMKQTAQKNKTKDIDALRDILEKEAIGILEEDIRINRSMGEYGQDLIKDGDTILTHCNAGALATAGYGTALGVIRSAHNNGKYIKVIADETRPFLQGARLTAWELKKDAIPVTVITDNMAGYFMKKGEINLVVVGADRIAANGDVANKIGTYSAAVLARENNIPFYVAAPISTLDLSLSSGDEIPIEERDTKEVTHLNNKRIAPEGIDVFNPAFDITPNRYVNAIITERGIARPPFIEGLKSLVEQYQ